ncbi:MULTISPECIES: UDP-N-acetylmuramate dehydrogenase [Leptospira]|uniref:UDP-N-acetylenolpyruvoylglucosamine reductase n=1 Tax=Leptospira weilii str. Ecochallenge TaxID=1049986 RepID=N1UAA2_9LEPT|nr:MULTISPECIES: UDP-N-acetylmuramate dehydrogenase [Leptospira]EMY12995.1 UDP-N-acetylmuramate dehydrogenase [Leptospira weilii str. Ecochallenge]MDL5246639.1 UDP-N-acetylmuramate dehydrogenase [Leptospira weilii]OMI15070.1 UDP-N-acetylenolpyruvoylglucosamine reductase [Leptospira weilii serovar Heyan]ULH30642.1 UDP-N-acetylmuramate dehydrogenase [Leptospira weilii]UPY80155.1 UDP-N-acetylmuramate dehydrogenase [Leptospira weilii]
MSLALSELRIRTLKQTLESSKIPFKSEVRLDILSSFKIGGICPVVVEPENSDQVLEALFIFYKSEIPWKILGGGSNLLISDHPDNFVTLRLSGKFKEFQSLGGGKFRIGAATNTTPTFRQISQSGYTGAEFLSTIPGWTGGAVIQNAGCYGGELFDLIQTVEFLRNNEVFVRKPSEIKHGYRFTEFLNEKNSIILGIEILLKKGNLEEIQASLKEKRDRRNSSQPENKKSAGSVFKNPKIFRENGKEIKAWELIDQAGLRGQVKGGAQISPEHCNFIVNVGAATAADVNYLVELTLNKVFQTTGVRLNREIEYFGDIP